MDRFIIFLKRLHVEIVAYYLNTINSCELFYAKLINRKIVYSHYARVNNFGDMFNKDLIRFFNAQLIFVPTYKESEAALTGSILGTYLRDFTGYVLGAGFILDRYNRKGNNWKVKIIRGPLSAKQCGVTENVVFADPGILASQIYSNSGIKKYKLGIIPHSRDVPIFKGLQFDENVKFIHPRRKPAAVAKDIMNCEYIASSSLHGLIFADAFRVPNIHIKFSDNVIGGLHKFEDYYLGMDAEADHIDYKIGMGANEIINSCKLRYTEDYLFKKQEDVKSIISSFICSK
ncbi:MAG: hypothetical protein COA40_00570 [Aequorivita sp.]|nr:MAG: hypothetical protein COA40_00570 [Aequorivita sp.]